MGAQQGTCPNCERLEARVAELERQLARALARIAELETQLAAARKNSRTSSKPPSSDIVKPPRSVGGKRLKKRKRGGQPGHPLHERPAFAAEEINKVYEHFHTHCPDCGHVLQRSRQTARVVQQAEIIARPLRVEEHRAPATWCPHCRKVHYAPLPEAIRKAGLLGPRLTTLVAYLKSVGHASFSTIRKFLRDVVGITVSRGQLAKTIQKASEALAETYEHMLKRLPGEPRLNVDETGHKDNGRKYWTWCFRADLFTLFRIDPSRGSQVLLDVLGAEFEGVLGCDYFGAYRRFMAECDIAVQFCLAHLIREVKFLLTLPDRPTRNYARRLRDSLRALFAVIHRREFLSEATFQKRLRAARDEVLRQAARRVPSAKGARNLAKRFHQHGDAYFRFITTPGIEPTNNLAEQAVRFVVIDRRITQGTRSPIGRQWCQRIWTVIATCVQQGRNIFQFLNQSVHAYFHNESPPLLLLDTS
jgi:transposase